jgi:tRNA threonylcarbamoyladenosine biosynthesis protein TsaB
MSLSITIQNTTTEVQLGLFKNGLLHEMRTAHKTDVSKGFILLLDDLLQKNKLTLNDIDYITVNQGPGPFTTLRVIIASINGLSFARHIPLIGIDGLNAFIHEHHTDDYPYTIALLNAFNNDVYFAIENPNQSSIEAGYNNIHQFLKNLMASLPAQPVRFIGNGTALFKKEIEEALGNKVYIPADIPLNPSLKYIGLIGYGEWQKNKKGSTQLLPLYLKKHPVEMSLT